MCGLRALFSLRLLSPILTPTPTPTSSPETKCEAVQPRMNGAVSPALSVHKAGFIFPCQLERSHNKVPTVVRARLSRGRRGRMLCPPRQGMLLRRYLIVTVHYCYVETDFQTALGLKFASNTPVFTETAATD